MKIHIGTFTIMLVTMVTRAAIFDNNQMVRDIESFIQSTMECRHVPGLTISIVKGNETWSRGFGMADFDSGIKVDNSSLFGIGSVTKSFTMTLLGILLTEKEMDWTAKVIDILGPEYGFITEYRTNEMTLKDLLSHRSGLSRLDLGLFAGYSDTVTRTFLSKRMKYVPEEAPFRDKLIYNNYMYMLLGHVAEKLGGDTWENLVTSRLFEPIGMEDTKILSVPDDSQAAGVARPYIYKDGKFENATKSIYSIHPDEPAGAILSSSGDMAKYMRFVLNNGRTDDGLQLLDEKLFKQSFKSIVANELPPDRMLTAPTFPVSDTQSGYGQAWFTSTYQGYNRNWHSGGLFSYITLLWLYPDIQTGIFASVNGPGLPKLPGYALATTLYYISDFLIGDEPWLNTTTTCTYPEPWTDQNTTSPNNTEPTVELTNPQQYAGRFGSQFISDFIISPNPSSNRSLVFQLGRLGGLFQSTRDQDRFLLEVTEPWEFVQQFKDDNNATVRVNCTFTRTKGEISALTVKAEVDLEFTKDFTLLDDVPTVSSYGVNHQIPMLVFLFIFLVHMLR